MAGKKMYFIKTIHIIVIVAGIILSACTPEACLDETESYLKATFYSSATKQAVKPDSLTVFGSGMESNRIYSAQKQLSMARLPLNNLTGFSAFIIRINGRSDTLNVNYSSFPHLISKECGYSFNHNVEKISNSYLIIDSIRIINPIVTNENRENIRIYF
ncbi:MAG TPA: DUF6452 family protein [Bacteroidales bacterium]|nr:DUF6452 family protein [Bacteroidales bacterium]